MLLSGSTNSNAALKISTVLFTSALITIEGKFLNYTKISFEEIRKEMV